MTFNRLPLILLLSLSLAACSGLPTKDDLTKAYKEKDTSTLNDAYKSYLEAMKNEDFETLKKLDSADYQKIVSTTIKKETAYPLHYAITFNKPKLFEYFVTKTDIEALDNNSKTALMLAVEQSKMDWVEKLIEAGANLNTHGTDEGKTALVYSQDPNTDIAKFLIQKGANPHTVLASEKIDLWMQQNPENLLEFNH